jgi:hypothetical protein
MAFPGKPPSARRDDAIPRDHPRRGRAAGSEAQLIQRHSMGVEHSGHVVVRCDEQGRGVPERLIVC